MANEDLPGFVDLIDDAVLSPPGRVHPEQLVSQWLSDPVGLLCEGAVHELGYCGDNPGRVDRQAVHVS